MQFLLRCACCALDTPAASGGARSAARIRANGEGMSCLRAEQQCWGKRGESARDETMGVKEIPFSPICRTRPDPNLTPGFWIM